MNNQKGFSAVIVLLSILVVTAVGFTGYYVWDTQQNKPSPTKQAQPQSTTPTPTTSNKVEAVSLKSKICSSDNTFCFNYPEAWVAKAVKNDKNAAFTLGDESITVTAPTGSSVVLNTNVSGFGGVCTDVIEPVNITAVKTSSKNSSRSIITTSSKDKVANIYLFENAGSKPQVGSSTSCDYMFLGLVTKSNSGKSFQLIGESKSTADSETIVNIIDSLQAPY